MGSSRGLVGDNQRRTTALFEQVGSVIVNSNRATTSNNSICCVLCGVLVTRCVSDLGLVGCCGLTSGLPLTPGGSHTRVCHLAGQVDHSVEQEVIFDNQVGQTGDFLEGVDLRSQLHVTVVSEDGEWLEVDEAGCQRVLDETGVAVTDSDDTVVLNVTVTQFLLDGHVLVFQLHLIHVVRSTEVVVLGVNRSTVLGQSGVTNAVILKGVNNNTVLVTIQTGNGVTNIHVDRTLLQHGEGYNFFDAVNACLNGSNVLHAVTLVVELLNLDLLSSKGVRGAIEVVKTDSVRRSYRRSR